ncbi:hypothetical protein EJB05_35168, partial [Eragrostis curvula]
MAKVSPLHKVIDAGLWDAEHPLGRLFILVHAAFLDAGFVPLPHPSGKRRPIPREAGQTASALSLRYTVPELLCRRRGAQATVVLRQQVYGRKIVLYVQRGNARPVASSWVVVADALAAVALLSGGLDATARALRRDARLAALWRGLRDALCRRALVDLCRGNGVAMEPTFASLPGDVTAAILARLADGADLARVAGTCAALWRLVAEHDRELWKPMYDALPPAAPDTDSSSEEMSWKQRYLRARLRYNAVPRISLPLEERLSLQFARLLSSYLDRRLNRRPRCLDSCNPPEVPADSVPERPRKRRTAWIGWHAAGIGRVPMSRGQDQEEWRHGANAIHARSSSHGQEKRRHGAGAVHAPSSRYRWKHR